MRRRLLGAVGKELATLHRCAVPPFLQPAQQEPWLGHMLKQARYNLQHYDVVGSTQLLEPLEQHQLPPVSPTLIHGDFALDNALILNGAVSGLVDWAWGAAGDP